MRVFVTGASGFIGSAVTKELLAHGHQVVGLTRSDKGAAALKALGADVVQASTAELEILDAAVAASDGVIHLAFNHDFSKFQQNCEDDRLIVLRIGKMLAGSNRPLIVTSGVAVAEPKPGKLPAEDDKPSSSEYMFRSASEKACEQSVANGTNAAIVRLPQVHDTHKQGLISFLISIAQAKGHLAIVGDGQYRWAAAHVLDVARLYRLALERAESGAIYHAVAEEGISLYDITEVLARKLDLPVRTVSSEQAFAEFGALQFAMKDLTASSAKTRQVLGWSPNGPGLLQDLEGLDLNEVH